MQEWVERNHRFILVSPGSSCWTIHLNASNVISLCFLLMQQYSNLPNHIFVASMQSRKVLTTCRKQRWLSVYMHVLMVVRRKHVRQKRNIFGYSTEVIRRTFKPLCAMIFCQILHHNATFNEDETACRKFKKNPSLLLVLFICLFVTFLFKLHKV